MTRRNVARILIVIACFLIAIALLLSVQFVFNFPAQTSTIEPTVCPSTVPVLVPTTVPVVNPTIVITPVSTPVIDHSHYYLDNHNCDCCKPPFVSSFARSKQFTQCKMEHICCK